MITTDATMNEGAGPAEFPIEAMLASGSDCAPFLAQSPPSPGNQVLKSYTDGVYWLEPLLQGDEITDLVLSDVNDAGAHLMRIPTAMLVGRRLSELLCSGARLGWLRYASEAWKTRTTQSCPLELRDPAGLLPTRWFSILLNKVGCALVAVAREETRERRLERQLARATERLKRSESISQVGSWSYDLRKAKAWWSDETRRILGVRANPVDSRVDGYVAMAHVEDRAALFDAIAKAISHGQSFSHEHRIVCPDGRERTVRSVGNVVIDERNVPTELVGTVEDLTTRLMQQEQMRTSEELRARVLEAAPLILFAIDTSGIVLFSEGRGLSSQQLMAQNFVNRSVFDVFQDAPDYLAAVRRALAGESVIAVHETRGAVFEHRLEPTRDAQGQVTGLIGVATEITEQRRAQAELEHGRSVLRAIIDTLPARIMVTDADGAPVLVNRLQGEAIGLPPDEAVRQGIGCPPLDVEAKTRLRAETRAVLVNGESFDYERECKDHQGGQVYDRILRMPLHDSDSEIVGVINMGIDITAHKQAEAQLRQAQKMEAVGQLAGGVAHDFNNLLQIITGYGQIAAECRDDPAKLQRSIERVLSAAERARALTRQLLAFSRRQVLQPKTIDLNALVVDLMQMVGRLLGEHITLSQALTEEPLWVHVDPGMIEQLLLNLCVNARDAMQDGGSLTLETQYVSPDANIRRENGLTKDGSYVLCSVTDTGTGIAPEHLQRMFEPFFSTKGEHQGTGLGLSIAYGIAQQHGGQIRVESQVGSGAKFTVWLPASEASTETDKRSSEGDHRLLGNGETILVVEDEQSVLDLLVELLKYYGYRVLSANDGMAGMEMFRAHRDEIRLVILDVVMPKLSGREVALRIRQESPGTTILLSSGYAEDIVNIGFTNQNGLTLLEKPYSPTQLLQTVRKLIDSSLADA